MRLVGAFNGLANIAGWLGSSVALSTLGLFLIIRSPSWKTGLLLLGLVFLQIGLRLVYQCVSDLMHMRAARRNFMRVRTGYTFKRISLHDPITKAGHYHWAGRDRLAIVERAVKQYHDGRVDPLIIYQGTSSCGTDVFPACASYPGIHGPSIVLVFDDPGRTPVARFRFYHELAHVGWIAPGSASHRFSIDPIILLLIFLIGTAGMPVVLGCVWVLLRLLSLKLGDAELQEELVADRIALHQLGKSMALDDVARVVQMLERAADAAIRFSGHRAGLAYARARFANAYAPRVMQPPYPFIRPRRIEGCFGLFTIYYVVFVERALLPLSWFGVLGTWVAVLAVAGLFWLLLGFVLDSGDRLTYDQNIDK